MLAASARRNHSRAEANWMASNVRRRLPATPDSRSRPASASNTSVGSTSAKSLTVEKESIVDQIPLLLVELALAKSATKYRSKLGQRDPRYRDLIARGCGRRPSGARLGEIQLRERARIPKVVRQSAIRVRHGPHGCRATRGGRACLAVSAIHPERVRRDVDGDAPAMCQDRLARPGPASLPASDPSPPRNRRGQGDAVRVHDADLTGVRPEEAAPIAPQGKAGREFPS